MVAITEKLRCKHGKKKKRQQNFKLFQKVKKEVIKGMDGNFPLLPFILNKHFEIHK